jgi:hypothetical protein
VTAVLQTPRLHLDNSELENGLCLANHLKGDQSAYVGTQNGAREVYALGYALALIVGSFIMGYGFPQFPGKGEGWGLVSNGFSCCTSWLCRS